MTLAVAEVNPRAAPRILVVEPDDDTRALYRETLRLARCEVVEASDGRDALTKALVRPPSLVLTGLRLDGYALCEILRRDSQTYAVPILVITAESSPADIDHARKVGVDAVFVTPVPPETIVGELRRLLGRSTRSERRRASTTVSEQATTHDRAVLVKTHARFTTKTPPAAPPVLTCPFCDAPLTYEHSHVGGVSERHSEQWDYFTCATCGPFQYRQRTRKLRRLREMSGQPERRRGQRTDTELRKQRRALERQWNKQQHPPAQGSDRPSSHPLKEHHMAKNIRIDAPDEPRTGEDREQRTPSQDDIARRAYDLYQARGAEQGRDMDDWLRAERELQERQEG